MPRFSSLPTMMRAVIATIAAATRNSGECMMSNPLRGTLSEEVDGQLTVAHGRTQEIAAAIAPKKTKPGPRPR
jgi:hypothetical protein